jgi:hypothetical protein
MFNHFNNEPTPKSHTISNCSNHHTISRIIRPHPPVRGCIINDLTPGPSPWRRWEVVVNQCVTKLFAIFLLSDTTEVQMRLPYNTNHKNLVKRLISESTPLLQGEGAGGEVTNDTAPEDVLIYLSPVNQHFMLRRASSPPFLGRGWGWGIMTEAMTISRVSIFWTFRSGLNNEK